MQMAQEEQPLYEGPCRLACGKCSYLDFIDPGTFVRQASQYLFRQSAQEQPRLRAAATCIGLKGNFFLLETRFRHLLHLRRSNADGHGTALASKIVVISLADHELKVAAMAVWAQKLAFG